MHSNVSNFLVYVVVRIHIGIHNPYMSTTIMFRFILEKFLQHFPIVLQVHKMEKAYYSALSKYAPREQKEQLSKFLKMNQA